MNIWAMLVLAAIVVSEKLARRGETIGRLAGAVCLVLAVFVLGSPRITDAVVVPSRGSMSGAKVMPLGG